MLYVIEVVLQLLFRTLYRGAVNVVQLRPTGDARFDAVPGVFAFGTTVPEVVTSTMPGAEARYVALWVISYVRPALSSAVTTTCNRSRMPCNTNSLGVTMIRFTFVSPFAPSSA